MNNEINIPKKRGRKPKIQIESTEESTKLNTDLEKVNDENNENVPKKRGRKPKNKSIEKEK